MHTLLPSDLARRSNGDTPLKNRRRRTSPILNCVSVLLIMAMGVLIAVAGNANVTRSLSQQLTEMLSGNADVSRYRNYQCFEMPAGNADVSRYRNLALFDMDESGEANLKVSIGGATRVSPGQRVNYLIEYRNDGLKAAADVSMVMKLPLSTEYVSSTGVSSYSEEPHQIVWYLGNIPPKSVQYEAVTETILFGLPQGTLIDNLVSISTNETSVQVDPSITISYDIVEERNDYARVIGEITNSSINEVFEFEINITEVSEEIEPILETTETLDEIEYRWQFTAEGHSTDYVDMTLKGNKRISKIVDTMAETANEVKVKEEHKAFLEALLAEGLITPETHSKYSGWNNFRPFLPVIHKLIDLLHPFGWITQFLPKKTIFGSPYANARLWDEIKPNYTWKIGNGQDIWGITDQQKLWNVDSPEKLYELWKESQSCPVSLERSTIAVARDPNIKYGVESYVSAGQKLDYRVEFENEGEGTAFGVYFTDTLDEDLNASTLQVGPVISTNGSIIAGSGIYDQWTRTVTWLVGEVGPGEGGCANFSMKVRDDAPEYAEVINFATVYFPSVPETTRTNAVVSVVGRPDIAVSNIAASKSVVAEGSTFNIDVTAANKGYYQEAFNLTLYVDTTVIQTENVTLLGRDGTTTVFLWNTTGFAKGNYTVSAHAEPVLGETYTTDNSFTGGWFILSIVGDITGPDGWPDGMVNMYDVGNVARRFMAKPPSSDYNPNFDINDDGIINMIDIGTVARHFGEHYP